MSALRDEIDALAADLTELEQETLDLDARAQPPRAIPKARAQIRPRLPVLDNLRVAAPCSAWWEDMTGDDQVRRCAVCKQDVFDLSAMTRDQAEGVIADKAGRSCGPYYQRHDGTTMLSDCPVGSQRRRRGRTIAAVAFAALASITGLALLRHVDDNRLLVDRAHGQEIRPNPFPRVVSEPHGIVQPPDHPPIIGCDFGLDRKRQAASASQPIATRPVPRRAPRGPAHGPR